MDAAPRERTVWSTARLHRAPELVGRKAELARPDPDGESRVRLGHDVGIEAEEDVEARLGSLASTAASSADSIATQRSG